LESLAIEDVGIFCSHLAYFTAVGNILGTLGIVCGNLVFFSCFGMFYLEKSGNPESGDDSSTKILSN
jgi:hypothetical protein